MKVLGIGWAGTRTPRHTEMSSFCKEVLGLTPRPRVAGQLHSVEAFALPRGGTFEVVGMDLDVLPGWECPKVEFMVEDVAAARAEMETKGVQFLTPVATYPRGDGTFAVWTDFLAPDGHIYGLCSKSSHPDL